MKCLVLGGGGFIGSAIVDQLLAEGHFVRVFERPRVAPFRSFAPHEDVDWVTGDLLSSHDVGAALEGIDTVFHLVSTTLPKGSNDDPIYDVQSNLVGTLQILNLMVQRRIPKIVFISSGGTVYGSPAYLPIDEQHPTNPQVSYGITKLAIEKYIQLFQKLHGIKAVILRLANPYGERQRVETAQGAVAVFMQRALRKQCIDIWGDGSVTRDYLYIQDVAAAFLSAAKYDGPESVFNIGSGQGRSLNDLLVLMESTLGAPIERRYLESRPFDVAVNVLDTQLAQRELNWSPKTPIELGLARTADWIRSQIS
ncbi:MAG: NAD-dependent epimerase/dehydratase family protein [Rhizobacter sp.]|nr:NAD-dependent epimerase/dehydratase family protein [Rhizobacter sp.]